MRVVVFFVLLILFLLFYAICWILNTLFHFTLDPIFLFGIFTGIFIVVVLAQVFIGLTNNKKVWPSGWLFGFTLFAAFLLLITSYVPSTYKYVAAIVLVSINFIKGKQNKQEKEKHREQYREKTNYSSKSQHSSNKSKSNSQPPPPQGAMSLKKAYDILKITQGSSPERIREVYNKLSLIYHPDHNNKDPNANKIFIEIKDAYEYLKKNVS